MGLLVVDGSLGETPDDHLAVVARWERTGVLPLEACAGEFAAVACDWASASVVAVRDRFGTRSLMWSDAGDGCMVASEPAILSAAGVPLRIDPEILSASLHFRWLTGAPHLLAPVRQVPAAHEALLRAGAPAELRRYWQISFVPEPPETVAMSTAVQRTQEALRNSLETALAGGRRPVVLLSGGVDSSILAALVREIAPGAIAVTAKLPDSSNPELDRAQFVAQQLGVPLRVVTMPRPTAPDFAHTVERLQELPRNPNNVVLQQLVQAAADEGDLYLQGDGAEVLFGLADAESVARFSAKYAVVGAVPTVLRRWLVSLSNPLSGPLAWRARRLLMHTPDSYAATLAEIQFTDVVRRCLPPAAHHFAAAAALQELQRAQGNHEDALHAYQMQTELSSSLLRHERLSVSAGTVSVAPFLRPAVVDAARRLPRELRNAGRSRAVLRALCDRLLPDRVSRWPKLGFEVPWATWLEPVAERLAEPHAACELLPPGFVRDAVRVNDPEAVWTAFALRSLVDMITASATAATDAAGSAST